MDEINSVLEDFGSKLNTDSDYLRKYRLLQYKSVNNLYSDQGVRREFYLSHQQTLRDDEFASRRGIMEFIKEAEIYEDAKDCYKPTVYVPGFNKQKQNLSNTLMFSEWMVEVPSDLFSKWFVLPCPEGIRVLLIAKNGITKIFFKDGNYFQSFKSSLPGGNCRFDKRGYCVLDCIWNKNTKSIYVLDVIFWGSHPILNCDMDFRDNWLKSKFIENPSLNILSEYNQYPIYCLSKYPCDKDSLCDFMSKWPPFPNNSPVIDGFLFYHKDGQYVGGITPLVVWLFPYMVNDIIGADIYVHQEYSNMRPECYIDQKTFIQSFEERKAKRIQQKDLFEKKKNATSQCSSDLPNKSLKSKKKKKNKKGKNNMIVDDNVFYNDYNDMNIDMFIDVDNRNRQFGLNRSIDVDSAICSMDESFQDEKT